MTEGEEEEGGGGHRSAGGGGSRCRATETRRASVTVIGSYRAVARRRPVSTNIAHVGTGETHALLTRPELQRERGNWRRADAPLTSAFYLRP